MCRSLEPCKWENNHRSPRLPRASSPPSLSHLTAIAHVLSSSNMGEKNLCSLPVGLPGWCVGDFSSERKSCDSPVYRGPLPGGSLLCLQHPHREEREPSLTPTAAEGLRDGQRSIYQLVSRRERWRGGSGRGGDRGRSGRVRLGSERWPGYERRSRSGVPWAGLSWVGAASGGSFAPASARWTAPAPPPPYKGERAGSRGRAPPH